MTVAVIGLGKIGLPLAVRAAEAGQVVVGADIATSVVALVNRGQSPFPNESELPTKLASVVESGRLSATVDVGAACAASNVILVVVPLIVDAHAEPDFAAMDAATEAIGRNVRPGTLVSYETTLPVGTTRTRFAPALSRLSGLTVGEELFVCHSPERVYSGRVFGDLRRYPKLVGGTDSASEVRAIDFYSSILTFDDRPDLARSNGVWGMGSAEAAEFAKLAETTYRDVNIALANEFASFATSVGVDVERIIEAANSQPFSHIHRPGVAVGGHCIPVYPRFYLSGDPSARLPVVAREVNESMPERALDLLERAVGSLAGRRVAVLGATYRGDVKETAFSGAFPLVADLRRRGAIPMVTDPMMAPHELVDLGFTPLEAGEAVDFAVVQADHSSYRSLRPGDLPGVQAVLDGRRVLDPAAWPGVTVLFLGAPIA